MNKHSEQELAYCLEKALLRALIEQHRTTVDEDMLITLLSREVAIHEKRKQGDPW